jgi:ubiquinone/menaquinone biosynthesis C-methylase UbiE
MVQNRVMSPDSQDHGRSYWDRHARGYDAFMRLIGRPLSRALALTQDETRGLGRVLEVAAGTGLFTVAIARSAAQVVATDYSEAMLRELEARLAREDVHNVECRPRDLYALGDERGYDAVVCANVLHLVPDLTGALSSLRAVVRAGGKLVAPTFVHDETIVSRVASRLFSVTGFPGSRRFTTASLAEAIARAGFQVHRAETIAGLLPIGFVAGTAAAPGGPGPSGRGRGG